MAVSSELNKWPCPVNEKYGSKRERMMEVINNTQEEGLRSSLLLRSFSRPLLYVACIGLAPVCFLQNIWDKELFYSFASSYKLYYTLHP